MDFVYVKNIGKEVEDVAEDMVDGLRMALGEAGIDPSRESEAEHRVIGVNPDLLWLNKAVFEVISSKDLPILYTWYRFGPQTPLPQLKPGNFHSQSLGECDNLNETREYSDITPYEYYEMFMDIIKKDDYFREDGIDEYLLDFYDRKAPSNYRTMYENNIQLSQVLAEIKDLEENPILNPEQVERWLSVVEDVSSETTRELDRNRIIKEDARLNHIEFFGIVEESLYEIHTEEEISIDDSSDNPLNRLLSKREGELLAELWSIYNDGVWKWTSGWISYDTGDVDKQCATEYRNKMETIIETQKSSWEDRMTAINSGLRDSSLIKYSKQPKSTRSDDIWGDSQEILADIDQLILENT